MDKRKSESYNVIQFQKVHNTISPRDLNKIMESLGGAGYLSRKGNKFRTAFWRLFRKE